MKVYVVTRPENGWDCVSGVYLDIDSMLANYKMEDTCEISYSHGHIYSDNEPLDNLVVHEKNVSSRQIIYGLYNNIVQNYNCYYQTEERIQKELSDIFNNLQKVEKCELVENGIKIAGKFVYVIHPFVLN